LSTATSPRVRPFGTVHSFDVLDSNLAAEFLTLYRDAFRPLEHLAPARQSLTDDEFMEEMSDPSVVKFVARDTADETVGLAFMATDLSVVPWISVPFFATRFPDHYARGALYYFGALLVTPNRQGGPWARLLLEELIARLAADRAVAAFDCCQYNVDVVRLPRMISKVANRLDVLDDAIELDPQRYFAYIFSESQ
jgi:GNAT superfamily N-acetyltransferase